MLTLLLLMIACCFLSRSIAQSRYQKIKIFKIGTEYSVAGNGYGGCDYKVSGAGLRVERQWQQSKAFSFLLSLGYQYFSGYSLDKSLGRKNFSYLHVTAAERFYPVNKLFVQAQSGLSTWGPAVSGGFGYQVKNFEAGVSYRSVVVSRQAVCYKYPNEEHLNFAVMFIFK